MMEKRIKLPQLVIVKAPGLLDMMYKVSELASDLRIPERTLREWLDAGAPHERDTRGHTWIHGKTFAIWVEGQRKPKAAERKLADNEALCLHCKAIVELANPEPRPMQGKLVMFQGTCPECGGKINRGGRAK